MKWTAALSFSLGAVLAVMPVLPTAPMAQTVALQTANWVRIFANDIEVTFGRGVYIDGTSIMAGGLGLSFREAEVMLHQTPQYPRGTTVYSIRSVDCPGSRVITTQWQIIAPNGAILGASSQTGAVTRVQWDTQDGKVLRAVCQGIQPR